MVLRNIAVNVENIPKIVAAGAIPPLVSLLSAHNSGGVQAAAAEALCNLAIDDDNWVKITDAGAIPPLVVMLGAHNMAAVQEAAAKILSIFPRMRSSEGVSEGGKHGTPVTENPPRPSRRPRCSTGLWHGVLRQVAQVTQNRTSTGLCTCAENAAHKRGITLGTHISRVSNWPAIRCYAWHVGSDAQLDQWAAGPCKGAPMMPGRGCSETKKCGHTASIPTPKPKWLRSSQAAGMSQQHSPAQVQVHCRELITDF